jgi:hypothetical protein
MKNLPLFIIFSWIIFSGCNSYSTNPKSDASRAPSFRINENGDTVLIHYYENGAVVSEVTIKYHKMNGLAINYYENGKIQNDINYKNGQKEGRVTWNYESGKLYRETQYVEGEIDGIQKMYYEDGKLMAEVPYVKSELQTGTKEYNSDGKLITNYPEIIFEPVDRTAFDNRFILRVSLSKKQKDTKFFRQVEAGGKTIPIGLVLKEGCAEISWPVPKGTYIMEKVRITAEFDTSLGNPKRIEKTYNLAVENR